MRHTTSLIAVLLTIAEASWAMSVGLQSSVPSPAPLGKIVTWTASVAGSGEGTIWYRFRGRAVGQDFRVIKDFGPDNTLDWTSSSSEGFYEIEVTARNLKSGDSGSAAHLFEMLSLVTGDEPVVTPTGHPLVFLYSAPPCAAGSRMRVRFGGAGVVVQTTPLRDCRDGKTMNFYIAGLRPQTEYSIRSAIDDGSAVNQGPVMTVATEAAGPGFARQDVVRPHDAARNQEGVVLQAPITGKQLATDLDGNLIWYYPGALSYITRPSGGGHFFGILQDPRGDSSRQIVREFDLAGVTIRETNAARVSEQLVAMGHRPITAFHHEARRLPDGKILALASIEQLMTDVQGPGPVDVLGDMIVVMDSDLQVLWAWDAFDHLDVRRLASFREQCPGGCPPLYLATSANDWTHGNSVQQTPDGNLLLSLRHQDWVIKINYQNGAGSGDVIWRLGKDGDFTIASDDPSPWFSHQHDPQFLADGSTLTLFDNSNVRHEVDNSANSRGQVFSVDEANRSASLTLNADLGNYCFALGAAQRLRNGNYYFHCGWSVDATSLLLEVNPSGQTVYALHAEAAEYRSFRMRDLYSP